MQGSMKTDRRIVRTAGLLAAVALFAATPVAAHAGPLLSGYGGPGQGNQAILGSTLLGGGSGGGSSGAGGGTGQAATATALASGSSAAPTSGASGTGHPTRAGHAAGGLRAHYAAPGAGALKPVSYPAVEPTAGTAGGLSLSGADISFVVLAAAALAITGALTRRMVRTRPAKGH
jgi:hypothetical protein